MVNVQFEEDVQLSSGGLQSRQILGEPSTPGMVKMLQRLGIRDKKVAGYVLTLVAVLAFIVSVFVFMRVFGRGEAGNVPPVPYEISGPPGRETMDLYLRQ